MDINEHSLKILKDIEDSVYSADSCRIKDILDRTVPTNDISTPSIIDALTRGMDRARDDLKNTCLSIPEFLFVVDAFREGFNRIKQPGNALTEPHGSVLIGIVEGEVHDLGKNIVAAVLEASGFRIIDQGREMSRDNVLEAIQQYRPSIVALSAMMSTCIPGMQDTVTWVRKLHPEVRIMVGGAALDAEMAACIGAHGYADSAATAADEALKLINDI